MSSMTSGTNVPDDAAHALKVLLDATAVGDYRAFVALGTERMKKGITPAMFDAVSRQLATRLASGYSAQFLTDLKQGNLRTYLWKVTFRDAGDEYVMRIALTAEGQVAGALIN